MRGSGWLLPILTLAIWLAIVAYPAATLILGMLGEPRSDVDIRSWPRLLLTSTTWSIGVALGAIMLGWLPGRLLGRSLNRRGLVPLATLMLVPICLPAYVIFYAWWQSWPAGGDVFRWVVTHQQERTFRLLTLYAGLVCWSWPLVAWCVAGSVAAIPAQREELLRLDGAPWWICWLDHVRTDRAGLALGGLLVFLATFNNTTCFDLAEVFTFANELRTVEALGANTRDAMIASWPAMAIAATGAALVWIMFHGNAAREVRRSLAPGKAILILGAVIWLVTVVWPLVMLLRRMWSLEPGGTSIQQFIQLYWRSVINTIGLALISGLLGALIALGLSALWQDRRRWVRRIAHIQAIGWLVMGLVPGTIIGVALESAYNRKPLDQWLYVQPIILTLGHLASFGFIAALLGRWIATSEPQSLRDLRSLDGAQTLAGWWQSSRPRLLAGAAAALAIVFVLAIGEIPVTARLNPPMRAGGGPLALSMLDAMHYQRPHTVMLGALVMMILALVSAVTVIVLWRAVRRSTVRRVAACGFATVILCGCQPDDSSADHARALRTQRTFGAAGRSLGQFNYPRCIAADPINRWLYVIDKSARVQRFSFDGQPQLSWAMPEFENGKPTGVTIAPDGRLFVADTHYFRVMVYDSDGHELMRFGEYGEGPRQFIYTTDVAFGPNGQVYVAEYGGHDRIQVFEIVDFQAHFLFEFGTFGGEWGQFNRPQSIAFNKDMTELFIADACNHRIVVTDPQGNWLRTFGSAGREPGQLTFPYGLTMLGDGTIMVAEFGNNRIQQFSADGRSLGVFGRLGRGPGELQYPWGVASAGDQIFVLDSGNNRVQVIGY